MDAAYVAPGADFRTYTKVMLDPGEVAFKKDWMRDVNDSSAGVSKDVTDEDAQKILAAARDWCSTRSSRRPSRRPASRS